MSIAFKINDSAAEKLVYISKLYSAYKNIALPYSDDLVGDQARFIEAHAANRVAGFIRIVDKSSAFESLTKKPVWAIADALVEPDFRHQGIFGDLIRYAVTDHHAYLLFLTAQNSLKYQDYFESLGFNTKVFVENQKMCWRVHNSFKSEFAENSMLD